MGPLSRSLVQWLFGHRALAQVPAGGWTHRRRSHPQPAPGEAAPDGSPGARQSPSRTAAPVMTCASRRAASSSSMPSRPAAPPGSLARCVFRASAAPPTHAPAGDRGQESDRKLGFCPEAAGARVQASGGRGVEDPAGKDLSQHFASVRIFHIYSEPIMCPAPGRMPPALLSRVTLQGPFHMAGCQGTCVPGGAQAQVFSCFT